MPFYCRRIKTLVVHGRHAVIIPHPVPPVCMVSSDFLVVLVSEQEKHIRIVVANVLWDTHTAYKHKTFRVPNPHLLEASGTYRFLQSTVHRHKNIHLSAKQSIQSQKSIMLCLRVGKIISCYKKKKTSAQFWKTVLKVKLVNRNASDHLSNVVEAVL